MVANLEPSGGRNLNSRNAGSVGGLSPPLGLLARNGARIARECRKRCRSLAHECRCVSRDKTPCFPALIPTLRSIRYNQNTPIFAPLAQLDRASGYEPEGREFESLRARHFFSVD